MTLRALDPNATEEEEEEEREPLTPEELRARVRIMALSQPDIVFSILEELMEKLDVDIDAVIRGGMRRWRRGE